MRVYSHARDGLTCGYGRLWNNQTGVPNPRETSGVIVMHAMKDNKPESKHEREEKRKEKKAEREARHNARNGPSQ